MLTSLILDMVVVGGGGGLYVSMIQRAMPVGDSAFVRNTQFPLWCLIWWGTFMFLCQQEIQFLSGTLKLACSMGKGYINMKPKVTLP